VVIGERRRDGPEQRPLGLVPHRRERLGRHAGVGQKPLDRLPAAAGRQQRLEPLGVVPALLGVSTVDGERRLVQRQLGDPRPLAAASSARTAPEDRPQMCAEPPASAITISRSSTSEATVYGAVSPLSPRPRRS
jgi:hypothetical protein